MPDKGEGGYELQDLIDATPNILTIIDPGSYRVHYENKTAQGNLGDICGQVCHQKIVQLQAPCPFCNMPKALETGVMQSSEVELPGGKWVMIQFAPIRHKSGALHIAETIIDITEQKKREQELARLTGSLSMQVRKLTGDKPAH